MHKFKCQFHLRDSNQLEGTLSSMIQIAGVSSMLDDIWNAIDKKQLQEKYKTK